MITLAFDTSTTVGSLALVRDDEPLVERTFGRDGLFPTLAALQVDLRTVDLIAVGVGPGSFTGIRVGIAAAKGLALPGGQPIKAASSFDALAVTVAPQMPAECGQMCVLSDARRGEIYSALYDRQGRPLRECRIGTLETLVAEAPGPMWCVGTEIEQYREALSRFAMVSTAPVYPRAVAVGRLARTSDLKLEPIYLRPTQYKTL